MDTRREKLEALKKEKKQRLMAHYYVRMRCRKLPITSGIRIT